MNCVGITSAIYAVVTRDGSRSRHGSQTRTHVSGGETGEAAGEFEPGQASPLVPKEYCSGEKASLGNELGCTSAIEHEIHIENGEPFKEWFWHIPPPLLEEVCASLWDMLEAGVICPSQSP